MPKRIFTLREIRDAVPGSRPGPPMTVRQAAELASISFGHLSNIEKGADTASPRLLWRLAQVYSLPYETVWDSYNETRRSLAPDGPDPPAKTNHAEKSTKRRRTSPRK